MSSRKRSASTSRTKSRYSNVLGYDRSRGGLQAGSRVSLMAAKRFSRAALELKGVDTNLVGVGAIDNVLTSTNDIVPLNLIAPGSGSFNRIGRKVCCKSVRIRGSFFIAATAVANAQNSDTVRMSLVWDKQPSGAAGIAWNNVFMYTPQTGTEADSLHAGAKFDNMERFVVLRDQTFAVNLQHTSSTAGSSIQGYVPFDIYVDLKNMETTFGAQTATSVITDINTGALLLMFRSENGVAQVSGGSTARLRFLDG